MTSTLFETGLFPIIESERLLLRDMTPQDATELLSHFGNPEVIRFIASQPIKTREQANEWLRWIGSYFADKEALRRSIVLKETATFIGCGGLYDWNREANYARIGFHILPDHRLESLLTEAARAFLQVAWNSLKLNRVEAEIIQGNQVQLRVLEKLGFQREGMLRQRVLRGGKYYDVFLYGLLRGDYEGLG